MPRLGPFVVTVLLVFVFTLAGLAKISGQAQMVEHFRLWGYPDWFRVLVGICEILGAAGLVVPRLVRPAAAGLGLIMVGAVLTHLGFGEWGSALAPLVLLGLLGALLASPRLEAGFAQPGRP
jgi:uncharacterized membrane protein YphA (DoxX/SURF4 family)